MKFSFWTFLLLQLTQCILVSCQNCADVPRLILDGSIFQRQPTAELLLGSNFRLRITWQLNRIECIDSVSVEFFERGNFNAIANRTSLSSTVTQVVQSDLPCNQYIRATVRVSSSGFRTSFTTGEEYIGGDLTALPSVAPTILYARQIQNDPRRIEMAWAELECQHQNARITSYTVEYGRTSVPGEVRRVTTTNRVVKSDVLSPKPNGLGFLQFGSEYWLRVAANNGNGRGPFSRTARATPLNIPSSPPPTTTPPPTTAPPTTTPPPTTTSTPSEPTTPEQIFTQRTSSATPSSRPPDISDPSSKPTTVSISPGSDSSETTKPVDIVSSVDGSTFHTTTSNETSATLNPSEGNTSGSNSSTVVAIVIVLLLIIVAIVTVTTVLILWMLWRHRSVLKRQRVASVNAYNDTFLEMNRDSQILSPKESPKPEPMTTVIYDKLPMPVAPSLTNYKKHVHISEGEQVNLNVEFTGFPKPIITWFFNGKRMDNENSDERVIGNNGSLLIPSVQGRHSGTYDFIVSNSSGNVEGCSKLVVYTTEKPPQIEEKRNEPRMMRNPINKELFGEHVSNYHALDNRKFTSEYQTLPSGEEGRHSLIGRLAGNRQRNRFRNITCYDESRMTLEPIPGNWEYQHDYINASPIDGYSQPKRYIAVQAPLPNTVVDLWRLVWQEKIQTITMLTSINEGKQKKCETYWPEEGSKEFGPFMVTLIEKQVFADYIVRTLHLVAPKEITGGNRNLRKVTQFHFTAWPDHGVPEYAGPLLMFLRRIKAQHKPTKGPILVHCNAGVGRTGVLISIDIALAQAARDKIIDVAGIVSKLRTQRMKMVQSMEQYAFIHDAVLEWIKCGDTQVPAGGMKRAMKRMAEKNKETGMTAFEKQFQVLQQVSPSPTDTARTSALANTEKNRSIQFLPPDKWRVVLRSPRIEDTYIHASFVNGYKQRKQFIIAQAPMKETTADFWKMVYERECAVIVMLSGLEEDGREVCHQYWPSARPNARIEGEKQGEHTIYTLETKREEGFLIRKFGITDSKTDSMKKITQFQLLNWTQEGVCTNRTAIMKLIDQLFILQRRTGNKPIILHGTNTVTRCGVFCSLLNCIECCKTESIVDVFQIVKALRTQKPASVTTLEQYQFIFELMLLFLNSFTLYSNFK